MDIKEFLKRLNNGEYIESGSEMHLFMHNLSQEAIKITTIMNNSYHTPEELRELMSKLTGSKIDESFNLFPPFLQTVERIFISERMYL